VMMSEVMARGAMNARVMYVGCILPVPEGQT
jgi:hypothetical protein